MTCVQYQSLQTEFPTTTAIIEKHFLPDLAKSVTDSKGHNLAGYLLFQLRRAARHAVELHGPERATQRQCDSQFAQEVGWQVSKKTQFRNFVPAIGTCIYNVVHERGERWRIESSPPDLVTRSPTLRVVNGAAQIGELLDDIKINRRRIG